MGELIQRPQRQNIDIKDKTETISKELFEEGKNIDLRTQLADIEIKKITKLRYLQKKFGLENIDVLIDSLLKLRVSLDRESRKEFIRGIAGEKESKEQKSLFKRLMGGGKKQNEEND